MDQDPTGFAVREALWLTLQLAGPMLAVLLAIGLVISLLQAMTQVQEATLAFLPKFAALAGLLLVLGPGMVGTLQGYASQLFERIVAVGSITK